MYVDEQAMGMVGILSSMVVCGVYTEHCHTGFFTSLKLGEIPLFQSVWM
jgi:hypothetical protein